MTPGEAHVAESVGDYLERDHRRLDGLLTQALAGDGALDLDAFERFRAGLLRHIGMEEKVLFPAALAGDPAPDLADRLAQLRREHGELAGMLVPTPSRPIAEDVRDLLAGHNRREEEPGGVYQACAAALGPAADDVHRRLRQYPEVPLAPHFDGPGTYRPRPRPAATRGDPTAG